MSDYKAEAWRMAGYYPGQYAKTMSALGIGIDYSDDDHDRYEAEFMADLAAHDAQVKADALREAAEVIRPNFTIDLMHGIDTWIIDPIVAGNKALHRAADRLKSEADRIEKEAP